LIASVGQFVREVALYWLAYEITGSAWALGILGFCEAAPRLLLGVVGGVIVDRYNRLRLLIGIQFFCAIPIRRQPRVGADFAGLDQLDGVDVFAPAGKSDE